MKKARTNISIFELVVLAGQREVIIEAFVS